MTDDNLAWEVEDDPYAKTLGNPWWVRRSLLYERSLKLRLWYGKWRWKILRLVDRRVRYR